MDTPCPANIGELLKFLPSRPKLPPDARYSTETVAYSAQHFAPPEQRPLCCRPYPEMLPELKKFLGGVVTDLGIGDISCQSMLPGLTRMRWVSFLSEGDVSMYGHCVVAAIDPIVQTIAEADGLQGSTGLLCDPVGQTVYSQPGDFNIIVEHRWLENGEVQNQPILVCSDENKAYSVLLSKAEDLSSPLKLDATKEQTNAKAMAVRLALQMVTTGVEYGFIFSGFIAIVARLVQSTDPSNPGTILLLSPANIPTEPFLTILVAILCSNILPHHSIKSPPHDLCQPLTLDTIPDADETEEDVGGFTDSEEDTGESSDIPTIDLQVATNAMILHHPWLECSDIHRISAIDPQSIPAAKNLTPVKRSLSLLKSKYLLRAPHFPSTNVDVVTLVDEIRLRIMKLVARVHAAMVLRELYMYEVC
ncbi:hypothetical protein IW262DRAFT_1454814 [Armillaria fumosa]|nr:hypothetical protein IW262DRAFT_1454814 [Armillaria fumosa]